MNESKYERGGASPQSNGFREGTGEALPHPDLGPLPTEWQVVRFSDAELPERGRVGRLQKSEYLPYGRYPVVDQGQQLIAGYTNQEDLVYQGSLPVIIFGDHTRIWKYVDFPFVCGADGTKIIQPNTSLYEPAFLFYSCLRLEIPSRGYNRHYSLLREQNFPLPPLPEQRAIARVLSTIQRAIEATEQVIAATRELKKSLMRHLFTYGPVPVGARFPVGAQRAVPQQETEIGPLPAHWQVARLGDLGKVVTGRTPPTDRAEYWGGSIPFITPVDLNGRVIFTAQRSITTQGLEKARALPKGTVLVSCIGYIGKVGMVGTDIAVTNQQINAVITNEKVNNWYLIYFLMRETLILVSRARMTTVPILHKTNFERIPVFLPPLPEQRAIAEMLRAVDEKIQAEENRKAALQSLFRSMLHHLMTGKVRVWAQRRCAPTMEA